MLKITHYGPVTRFDLARTMMGRGRYWTTCYLVDRVLIDTGCAHTAPELLRSLNDTPPTHIVNTHTHEDHIGADGPLQRQHSSINILAHPLALPVLSDPRHTQLLHPYRRLFWGWPEPCLPHALSDREEIQTEHYTFKAIYTPGHSPDHLCLYEAEQGWLFSGDLFVGGRDRALRHGHDIWRMIGSLKCVAALPITCLFPGSARVRQDPIQEIMEKIAYYEILGEQVLEMNERGWNVSRIARHLCGGPMWVEIITLGHFSRRQLVLSYLLDNNGNR
jgi:glyoxylase-like metal-dependent hydrolase (beta-lactamase superfamily II)